MHTGSKLEDEAFVVPGVLPRFTIDRDVRVAWLHAKRSRPELRSRSSLRCAFRIFFWTCRARIAFSRRMAPGPRWGLTRGSSFNDRSRGFGLAWPELLHLVTHVEGLARLQIDLLLVAAMAGHEYFELVIARFDVQTLEGTVGSHRPCPRNSRQRRPRPHADSPADVAMHCCRRRSRTDSRNTGYRSTDMRRTRIQPRRRTGSRIRSRGSTRHTNTVWRNKVDRPRARDTRRRRHKRAGRERDAVPPDVVLPVVVPGQARAVEGWRLPRRQRQ